MGITALFDILLFSVFVYGLIMLLKQTRALFVVYGIIIVSFVYGAAQLFDFPLTAQALNLFFSVFLIGIVILFQAELRRYFEIIAITLSPTVKNMGKKPAVEDVDRVVRVAERFAKEKTGMLVVFAGSESLGRHLSGGFDLYGKISEPLLESIFDASSPGHDGALVIEGKTITKFGVHLPLSQDFGQIEIYGTRHSAGLGIAEVSDALAVIVSEEKGTISVARDGVLKSVKSGVDLRAVINSFLREKYAKKRFFPLSGTVKNIPEKVLAVLLAVAAWFIVVFPHGN
jgi:uncharacterized protein (TIGR00159 family)